MNFLILIDGPKGSGKSTLSNLLEKQLENTCFLSLDSERRQLELRTPSITNDNKVAFQFLLEKITAALLMNMNVVVDCGVSDERIEVFEQITLSTNTKLYKFSLRAPYDTLLSRVIQRDKNINKIFNKERFDYTFKVNQSKSFNNFYIIDSSKQSPQDILEYVLSVVD